MALAHTETATRVAVNSVVFRASGQNLRSLMAVISPLGSRQTVAALLTLTVVSGLVDAVSYLVLSRVFVANMTGNVVFLGFAADPDSGL